MSSLIVEVCKVDAIIPHPNADRMQIACVKGWRTCVKKDEFKENDPCVFIPPDTILPIELSDRLGVTNYLSVTKDAEGKVLGGRVKVAKLRGQPSYGLIFKPEQEWSLGTDVATHYQLTKWEPPESYFDGEAEKPLAAFHKYYDLENIKNFPDVFLENEDVFITEKVHGKNARVGLVRFQEKEQIYWQFVAGSHHQRKKEYQILTKSRQSFIEEEAEFYQVIERSSFYEILDRPGIKELLRHLAKEGANVILFGEQFGSGIQDMTYSLANGAWEFRVFDISINGLYMDAEKKYDLFSQFNVPSVPVLYHGPFSAKVVEDLVSGPTTICDPEKAGKFRGREGIVITSAQERQVASQGKMLSRAALKAISFDYLLRKEGTEFK